jgi:two-component system, NarL family, response regulator YdfI
MPSKNGGGKTRVLTAAASPPRQAELERIVQENSNLYLVGSVSVLSTVPQRTAELHPDVILIDLAEPDHQVAIQRTSAAVVALVEDLDRNWSRQLLRGGVLGILPRNSSPAEIASAIHAASRGLLVVEPELIRDLVVSDAARNFESDIDLVEELTDREIEVLRMLAEGWANKEIASRLGISDHTVKFHISSILAKLAVSSRTEAVTVGIRKGLILL